LVSALTNDIWRRLLAESIDRALRGHRSREGIRTILKGVLKLK